jgi:hypothetical protein
MNSQKFNQYCLIVTAAVTAAQSSCKNSQAQMTIPKYHTSGLKF